MRRHFQLSILALLVASLLNCEDVQMANQRPVIGSPVNAQGKLDPNDVLYRNLEIAKHRFNKVTIDQGSSGSATTVLLYRNSSTNPVLIRLRVTFLAGLTAIARYDSKVIVGTAGIPVLSASNDHAQIAYEIILPGEEVHATVANGTIEWRVTSLNNLL